MHRNAQECTGIHKYAQGAECPAWVGMAAKVWRAANKVSGVPMDAGLARWRTKTKVSIKARRVFNKRPHPWNQLYNTLSPRSVTCATLKNRGEHLHVEMMQKIYTSKYIRYQMNTHAVAKKTFIHLKTLRSN